ncbi:MAG: IS3 family transposase, partial [Paracoccaceae bacterium]
SRDIATQYPAAQCKAELIWRNRWDTRRQAEGAIFQYINGFYNPRRRHSSLGVKSPLAFERKAA